MEIIKLEELKNKIDREVKWVTNRQLPEGLDGSEIGILRNIEYTSSVDKAGEINKDYSFQVAVKKNNKNYLIFAQRIFTTDSKEDDLNNLAINDKITVLTKQIADLEATKNKEIIMQVLLGDTEVSLLKDLLKQTQAPALSDTVDIIRGLFLKLSNVNQNNIPNIQADNKPDSKDNN